MRLFRNKYNKHLVSFEQNSVSCDTIEELCWCIIDVAISPLGWPDGVVYIVDTEKNILVQTAALGKKESNGFIVDEIKIKLGEGIVGSVAENGIAEIVKNTHLDTRYKVDDDVRPSEITVPIKSNDKVVGIIDAEHPNSNHYTKKDLNYLEEIAAICSKRIQEKGFC